MPSEGLWCGRCGRAREVSDHVDCDRALALEPPRFCAQCRRRMKVQVLPRGWSALCAVHGETRSDG
jgi:hypothetical protein